MKLLTPAQRAALKAAILTETDPMFVAARAVGDVDRMAAWFNAPAPSGESAWRHDVSARDLDEASDYTSFDAVSAGKRDAWTLFLQYAPRDFGEPRNRKTVIDVWGPSNNAAAPAFAILTTCTRPVTRVERLLGGAADETAGTGAGAVTARDLTWTGPLSGYEVALALNEV